MGFNPGDQVQMKSGGPPMTVHSFDGNHYLCTWMERSGTKNSPKYNKKQDQFIEAELVKVARGAIGFSSGLLRR